MLAICSFLNAKTQKSADNYSCLLDLEKLEDTIRIKAITSLGKTRISVPLIKILCRVFLFIKMLAEIILEVRLLFFSYQSFSTSALNPCYLTFNKSSTNHVQPSIPIES